MSLAIAPPPAVPVHHLACRSGQVTSAEEQTAAGPPGELNRQEGQTWSELLGEAAEAKTLNEFLRNRVCFFIRDG